MLTESQIIRAVCRYLKRRGWRIESVCDESQRGDDIVAKHKTSGRTLCIEAKGETSSRATSRRYGQAFNSAQVTSHVSRAFYRATQVISGGKRGAIALPMTPLHLDRVRRIAPALRKLKLEVFWVAANLRVTREGLCKL